MTEDRNNLVYWFPRLQASGVLVPKTVILEAGIDLTACLDGQSPPGYEGFIDRLTVAAEGIGYPVFLRTGHGSGKHEWNRTCFVRAADHLKAHVDALVAWSHMVDIMGLPHDVWAVRQYLPLRSTFRAFEGMPVTVERRYFIEAGTTLCHHPYWPVGAIRQADTVDYRERLSRMNHIRPGETKWLKAMSERVSVQFDGAWSLDWALGKDGSWYAIDMAEAERSYHWPTCRVARARGWLPV